MVKGNAEQATEFFLGGGEVRRNDAKRANFINDQRLWAGDLGAFPRISLMPDAPLPSAVYRASEC
jgi:hypothetical protein